MKIRENMTRNLVAALRLKSLVCKPLVRCPQCKKILGLLILLRLFREVDIVPAIVRICAAALWFMANLNFTRVRCFAAFQYSLSVRGFAVRWKFAIHRRRCA